MPEGATWAVHSPRTHGPRTRPSHPGAAAEEAPSYPGAAAEGAPSYPAAAEAVPSYPAVAAEAAPSHPGEAAPAATGPLLSRRVPQAHLAPELRRRGQGQPAGRGDASLPDATEARAALSRYQASRQAARAVVDENGAPAGRGDEGGPEPPSAGGWS
jgi:hypothetical protein